MIAGMTVWHGGSIYLVTSTSRVLLTTNEDALESEPPSRSSVHLSPSEARELAGALRRAADELDPIPEGAAHG